MSVLDESASNPGVDMLGKLRFSGELTCEIADALIDSVCVYDMDRIEICWKCKEIFGMEG